VVEAVRRHDETSGSTNQRQFHESLLEFPMLPVQAVESLDDGHPLARWHGKFAGVKVSRDGLVEREER
jgi:hypothetical protein